MLSSERDAHCADSIKLAPVNMHFQALSGFGVISSRLYRGPLCCSLNSDCVGGEGENGSTLLSSPQTWDLTTRPHCSRSHHKIVRVIGMTSTTALLCLIFGSLLRFKTPSLKETGTAWTHPSPLEKSLPVLCLVSFPQENSPTFAQCAKSMVWHFEKQRLGYPPSAHASVPCPMNGPLLGPAGSFVLGETLYLLSNVLQKENVLPQSDPGDPYTTLYVIGPAASLSSRVQATAPP